METTIEIINEYKKYLYNYLKQQEKGSISKDSEPLTFLEKYGYTTEEIEKETSSYYENMKKYLNIYK